MASATVAIDRARSEQRIEQDVEILAGSDYTQSTEAIQRYAYTAVYRNTLDYFTHALEELDYDVYEDPVGTLVARNRPTGEGVFGVGSHCDSNRHGGKYDGTLGVSIALEVCRLNEDLGLGLPLQLISFIEEEGSGFGQVLLGSRIAAQRVTEADLKEKFRAIDDGHSFWDHAKNAGYDPGNWRDSIHVLDDLVGWIETHIEQARVLQDTGNRVGVVTAIAGYIHGDIRIDGRQDHAGATPMEFRLDPGPIAAEIVLELERLAIEQKEKGTVGTVGEIEFPPSIINVVPGQARVSLDIRGVDEESFRGVATNISSFAEATARKRGTTAEFSQRQTLSATPMDKRIVDALEDAAKATGEPYMVMPSGAAHDTMCVADHVPTGLLFIPCKDGISHSPDEDADPADAALAAEMILNAIRSLTFEL